MTFAAHAATHGGPGGLPPDKGEPVARRGRKAKGLSQTAWLPKVEQ